MIGERFRLDGRTVVVAGAGGGGIGTAVCTSVAELGATVVGLDVDRTALAGVERAVSQAGGTFRGLLCDLRDREQVDRVFDEAAATIGAVSGLVHVVGGQRAEHWQPLDGYDLTNFDDVLDLNLRSALLTTQAAGRVMTASGSGGSIVHIASVMAFFAAPFNLAYGIAKAGLLSLTKTAATEWGARGIRVNAVGTGTIHTPHSRGKQAPDPARDAVLPLHRRGTPDDVAGAVAFLLTDLASFVTGHTLVVDGGSSIRPSYLDADNIPVFVQDGELRRRLTQ